MKGEFFMEKQKEQRYHVGHMIKGTINNTKIYFFALENIEQLDANGNTYSFTAIDVNTMQKHKSCVRQNYSRIGHEFYHYVNNEIITLGLPAAKPSIDEVSVPDFIKYRLLERKETKKGLTLNEIKQMETLCKNTNFFTQYIGTKARHKKEFKL